MIGYGDGNGRKNLFSVTTDGNAHIDGTVYTSGGADFGELFESVDGNRIKLGTPVVFDGQSLKIRPAVKGEVPFGVISNTTCFVGNAADEEWNGKYLRNADGSIIWESYEETQEIPVMTKKEITVKKEVIDYTKSPAEIKLVEEKRLIDVPETIPAIVLNPDGETSIQREIPRIQKITKTLYRKKISPLYNSKVSYVPRVTRKEWHVVGLLGVVNILKGAPTNDRWIKIKEDGEYNLWLIR